MLAWPHLLTKVFSGQSAKVPRRGDEAQANQRAPKDAQQVAIVAYFIMGKAT